MRCSPGRARRAGPAHLGQAPRQRLLAELVEVVARGREQLLEEERVAAGAVVQRHGHPVRRRPPVDGGEEGATSRPGEPFQPEVGHGGGARAGQQAGDGVPAGQLVGPVGADEQPAARPGRRAARTAATLSESAQCRSSNTTTAGRSPTMSADERQARVQPFDRAAAGVGDAPRAAPASALAAGRRARRAAARTAGPGNRARRGRASTTVTGAGSAVEELLHQAGLAEPGSPPRGRPVDGPDARAASTAAARGRGRSSPGSLRYGWPARHQPTGGRSMRRL